jgi:peptidyl-prolyl cis-trans isomerase C
MECVKMKKALLVIGILILAASCSKGGVGTTGSAKDSNGDYVAKVGDVKLTKEDVKVAWDSLPLMAKEAFQGPDGRTRFVDELARRESLYLEAKKRGLDQDKEVRMRLEEARKNALVGYLLKKAVEENAPKLTDKAMRDYYFAHQNDFTSRDKIRVSQIVVKNQADAEKVLSRLKAGENFAKVASQVSIDKATAKSGGDMGYIDKKSKLAPQLVQTILMTNKGALGGPVTLPDGLHILKVTDIKGAMAGYGQVKDIVSQRMVAEKRKEAIDKLLDSVKKSYKVEINMAAVSQLPTLSAPDMKNMRVPHGHPSIPGR